MNYSRMFLSQKVIFTTLTVVNITGVAAQVYYINKSSKIRKEQEEMFRDYINSHSDTI